MVVIPYLLLCLVTFVFNKANATRRSHYSIETPYTPPSPSLVLAPPPVDFELVCAQILTRHGCRTLKHRDYDQLSLSLWKKAKEEGALTKFGEQLGEDLQFMMDVNDRIGRGKLSGLGKIEQQGLVHRLTKRLSPLFTNIPLSKSSNSIKVVSSGESRALDSLNAFAEGFPPRLQSLIEFEPPNRKVIRFQSSHTYKDYIKHDMDLKTKIQSIRSQPYTAQMTHKILSRLYKQSFIERLANGYYTIFDDESGQSINNEVDAVRMLHGLYLVSSNLREEGAQAVFQKYFDYDESAWFAYLHDAHHYYTRGPSFSNRTITFDMAQVLLDDFFLDTEKCSQIDATHFLRVRFGHGGTISPFAALLKLPILSDKQTPLNETYTYQNNGWRGELVSPTTANIQWEIYRHYTAGRARHVQDQQILIRMLVNEYPFPFKYDCEPYNRANHFFYTLDELKRCYSTADPSSFDS